MREPGFYWVRFKVALPVLQKKIQPEIAFWNRYDRWVISGSPDDANDGAVEVLSERLEPPK